MRIATVQAICFLACTLLFVWVTPAAACEPALDGSQRTTCIKRDKSGRPTYLARFHDGPRRVPDANGADKDRADRLGIGGAGEARMLLWNRPNRTLLLEVPGAKPKQLLWPVADGHLGRGFGFTRRARPELPHNGVDISAAEGDVVRAAADGLVVYSDNGLRGYGNCVMILHAGGMLTLYAHNQETTVQSGSMVKRGEPVALVGATGYAWGPHLHFELRDNGRLRDPARLFVGNIAPAKPSKVEPSDAITRGGERRDLMPPGTPKFGKAIQQDRERPDTTTTTRT